MDSRQVIGGAVGPVISIGVAMYAGSWTPVAAAYEVEPMRIAAGVVVGLGAGLWLCLLLTARAGAAKPDAGVVEAPITQRGSAVATVVAPSVDLATGTVHFGQVYGDTHFDPEAEFEYRGHRLRKVTYVMATESNGRPQFIGLTCEILSAPAQWGP